MPFLQPKRRKVARPSGAATPPPPYQVHYEPPIQQIHPDAGYAYPYQPQYRPSEAYNREHGVPATAWASTSTVEIPRPQTAGAWQPGPLWETPLNGVTRPVTSGRDNCAVVRKFTQGAALCDRVSAWLADMRSRDNGVPVDPEEMEELARGLVLEEERAVEQTNTSAGLSRPQQQSRSGSGGVVNFSKTWLYHNSRLPPSMVPFKASSDVYKRPHRDDREGYSDADPKQGTKAFIIKSQTVDDKKLLVVAIRGSQKNRVDWLVNFGFDPKQPTGFLDDEGNWCHAGFLQVARAMISSVAAQLRTNIEQDPSWAGCSLLFTGHSAGGAVASLLYMHTLSRMVDSDLTVLYGVFRHVHCITFGTPPLSLLPLQKPVRGPNDKNVFYSFANEGDLVVRADWAYVKSLARLVAAPAPVTGGRPRLRERVSRQKLRDDLPLTTPNRAIRWPVPEASLSAAGRMLLLREKPGTKTHAVEAVSLTDGELRGVVFGDPAMHHMALYKQRVDDLAFAAVSGRDVR
ncbi:hypothetical protein LTR10_003666 [Elasticomyces elasticus]|nr:hypothetical protein LTR10_003666 [Elasticomyces elasticus]KAK4978143.1 hypothetical protein LTR42_002520 [Elasticomyces elasticus]